MKHLKGFFFFFLFCLLSACSNQADVNVFISKNRLTLAELHPNERLEQEVMIVRLGQALIIGKMSKKERASLHFERGVLYDSLGLWGLARYDFSQALMLHPKYPAIYNYLGVYLLLEENYDNALEAFNVVLDLDPNYEYAYLNRGLNFYYTERYNLAYQDFLTFYEANKKDPYRILWLYLTESKLQPEKAEENLRQRAQQLSKEYWGTFIVQFYLNQISVKELLNQAYRFVDPQSPQYAEVLTETYFYLAKQKLNVGEIAEAEVLFKLATANQVYNFVEYRFALFELAKIKDRQQANE